LLLPKAMRFLTLSIVFFLSLSAAADQVLVNSKGTIPTLSDLDKCDPIKSLFDGIEKDNSNIQFKFHCKVQTDHSITAAFGEAVLSNLLSEPPGKNINTNFKIASRLNFPESDVTGPVTIYGTPLVFTVLKDCKDQDAVLGAIFAQIKDTLSERRVEFSSSGCLQTEQGIILGTSFSKH
jgi:hypothetical protein